MNVVLRCVQHQLSFFRLMKMMAFIVSVTAVHHLN